MRHHLKRTVLLGAALLLAACGAPTAPTPATAPLTRASSAGATTAGASSAGAMTAGATTAGAMTAEAYKYYVSSVRSQGLGRPAALAEATPLILATCHLLATTTPSVMFRTIALGAQSGTNGALDAGVQEILLATSAAKFVCPTYLPAVIRYLSSPKS